jgi:carbonic anhydrase/acetyltransferase-like protein (isoleucine patch superfamily)
VNVAIYQFENRIPTIGQNTYVHPSASVIGDVSIGEGCWIGPGACIRGDYGRITIGNCTSIEENVVVHARPDEQTVIGDWVTIGHAAVIHNATIHDYAVIGMRAVVSDWAIVGVWSVVAEGAVVRQSQEVPGGKIAVGVPARLLEKDVTAEYRAQWTHFKKIYVDLARRYPDGLKLLRP